MHGRPVDRAPFAEPDQDLLERLGDHYVSDRPRKVAFDVPRLFPFAVRDCRQALLTRVAAVEPTCEGLLEVRRAHACRTTTPPYCLGPRFVTATVAVSAVYSERLPEPYFGPMVCPLL